MSLATLEWGDLANMAAVVSIEASIRKKIEFAEASIREADEQARASFKEFDEWRIRREERQESLEALRSLLPKGKP